VNQVTAKGQTVEEAVESALAQLNTTKDRIEINIIDEGKKGFFGIFGTKPAVVEVTLKDFSAHEEEDVKVASFTEETEEALSLPEQSEAFDPIEEAKNFILSVSEKMGAPVTIQVTKDGKNVQFDLEGEKIALLIGKRGQTLNSLQYLTQLVINRYSNQYVTIILDAEDYRKRRNETLIQLAERLAQKSVRTGQDVALEPMPSYERKVIHTALVKNHRIKTYSSGNEPHRHIVISPVKKNRS
jgi:spoIIIJ-associated protein